jgi:hypothetical protein
VLEEALVDYRVHARNTIRENDDRGRIEDNFVLEWHLSENSTRRTAATDILDSFHMLEQNKRASLHLILLFQLWRNANDNDLAKCVALFEDPSHPVMLLAMELSRKEQHRGLNLKARLRKLFWPVLANHKFEGTRLLTNCLALLRWTQKR